MKKFRHILGGGGGVDFTVMMVAFIVAAMLGLSLVLVGGASAWADSGGGLGGGTSVIGVGASGGGFSGGASGEAEIPKVYIKAINPGYTVDGKNNVGEMIEIGRVKDADMADSSSGSDELISLAGLYFSYTNSGGTTSIIVEFPEGTFMAGENILLRLASAPEAELANLTYSKTLAMKAGPLELKFGDTVIDSVCWTGGEGCEAAFKSTKPTVLVREDGAYAAGFQHVPVEEYAINYNSANYYVEESPDEGHGEMPAQCGSMMFSEILSYYAETRDEQFIELYNGGTETVLLDGCTISYKNKYYKISGMVRPEEYFVVLPSALGFNLTKNPTTVNTVELVDVNGEVVDRLEYPNGQRKGTAWAWVGYDENGEKLWRTTYAATPGAANNYQEYRTCEEGKVINETTGNCVKVTTVAEKICGEGKYLNILTGRCKKVEEATSTTCKEGYYYYEATGRCRKIVVNDGTDYSVTYNNAEYEEESSFVALYAVIGVGVVGALYAVWEFRKEIAKAVKKLVYKVRR